MRKWYSPVSSGVNVQHVSESPVVGVAMGAVVCGGRQHEHDGRAGCAGRVYRCPGDGEIAREGDGCEDKLTATLGNEAGETHSGIGSVEFDDAEVAIELLPEPGWQGSARW